MDALPRHWIPPITGSTIKPIRHTRPSLLLCLLVPLFSIAAPPPHVDRPGDSKNELPAYQPEPTDPGLILPPIRKDPQQDRLSRGIQVYVKKITITGNTVLSNEELEKLTAPYVNRNIHTSELQTLRQALTLHYINKGYINSGVVIPDQQVSDGVIELQVIEGTLNEIHITGNRRLKPEYIRNRLMLGAEPPLNINDLQQTILILQQNPLIKKIHTELKPGSLPGQSVLETRIEEAKAYSIRLGVNNHRPPSIGAERGEIEVTHRNITGHGDKLNIRYGSTKGLDDFGVQYDFPVNAHDTTIGLFYDKGDSSVTEEPFDSLEIESESETVGIRVSHPFYRTPNREFRMGLSLEHRESKTFLLGLPFSFSTGAVDGKSAVSVLRFSQEWTDRSQQRVIAVRSTFNVGLDAFDASVNHDQEDGKFTSWLGQFQWAQRIGAQGKQIIFRADTQLANDPLLPLEQFSVGGMSTVRGYRENQLVRDNGFVASVEYRMPVFNTWLGKNKLQLAAFLDFGRSWNRERATATPEDISSAGIGLRWAPTNNIYGDIYWGKRLRTVTNPDNDLQDDGIHFQFQITL